MKTFFSIYWSLILVTSLVAQDARISQTEELNRRRDLKVGIPNLLDLREEEQAPEVIPGDRDDLGPQYIVKRKLVRRWWDVKFDTQYLYTSNMLLQANNWHNKAVDTTLLATTAEFSFAPDPILLGENALLPKIGFRHQWFNYALGDTEPMFRYAGDTVQNDKRGYKRFDFDSQTIFGNLNYLVDQKWLFGLGFDFTRLLTHENVADAPTQTQNYSEFYKEYVPSWSVARIFQITPVTMAVIGYEGKLRYTDADNNNSLDNLDGTDRHELNNRLDSILSLSLRQQIVPTVFVQPFARLQYSNYNINDHRQDLVYRNREDITFTGGSSFSWEVTDWFTVSCFGSYEQRTSTAERIEEYDKFDLGGGLSANFRF